MLPVIDPIVPPEPIFNDLFKSIVVFPECVLAPVKVIAAPTCNTSSVPSILLAIVNGVARLKIIKPLLITELAEGKPVLVSVISCVPLDV